MSFFIDYYSTIEHESYSRFICGEQFWLLTKVTALCEIWTKGKKRRPWSGEGSGKEAISSSAGTEASSVGGATSTASSSASFKI